YVNDPIRFGYRQWSEQYSVDDAEDGRVRPDAESEREHRYSGEAGVLQQLAEGEFDVIHNAAPQSDRPSRPGARATSRREARPNPRAARHPQTWRDPARSRRKADCSGSVSVLTPPQARQRFLPAPNAFPDAK